MEWALLFEAAEHRAEQIAEKIAEQRRRLHSEDDE